MTDYNEFPTHSASIFDLLWLIVFTTLQLVGMMTLIGVAWFLWSLT